jgi:hypothetical protein
LTLTYDVTTSGRLKTPSVLTTGQANLDFTLGSTTCTGAVTGGQTCTIQVKFAPLTPGVRIGAVAVLDNAGTTLASNSIYGTGIAPAVAYAPAGPITQLGGGLTGPAGVAVDAKGDLFVVDNGGSAVKEFVAPGYTTPGVTLGSGFKIPFGVALDGSGNVFVADSGNKAVKEILAAGGYLTVKTVGTGFSNPEGVAVDGSGNVYVADSSDNTVKEILAAGGYTTVTTLGTGFTGPGGVAVDAGGNVFVADFGNNALKEILASSGYTKVNTLATGLSGPAGVALDAAGNVFVTENVNSTLVKEFLAPDFATVISLDTSARSPIGIALDNLGDVFIGSPFSHSIPQIQRSQPPAFAFANTQVGATSTDSPKAVQLQNIGNATLTATGLVISANFSQSAGSGTPEDCSGTITLAPGAECNLSLTFTPDSFTPPAGVTSGTATLTDNALNSTPNATQVIQLNGTVEPVTPTVTTISSSPSTGTSTYQSNYGDAVVFTATVANQNVTGTGVPSPKGAVSFSDGGVPVACTNIVTLNPSGNGSSAATCDISSLSVASHQITALYTPVADPNYLAAGPSAAITQKVIQPAATVTITAVTPTPASATSPYPYGTALTFSVTVSGTLGTGIIQPIGSVVLTDAASATPNASLCAAPLPLVQGSGTNPSAVTSCPISTLSVAGSPHQIVATYTPANTDQNYLTGTSSKFPITVGKAAPTVAPVQLTTGTSPSTYGAALTFSATVVGGSGLVSPTGSVSFTDTATNTALACTNSGALSGTGGSSTATCNISSLTGGTHQIAATYNPGTGSTADPNYLQAQSSAPVLQQTVNAFQPTVTITNPASNTGSATSNYGDSVTFTATVTGVPSSATGTVQPKGTVNFTDNGTPINAACTNANPGLLAQGTTSSQATCVIDSLSAGSQPHLIGVSYPTDGNYLATTSSTTFSQTVNTITPSVAIATSNVAPTYGTPVTLTATVTGLQESGTVQPIGSVTFTDNGSGAALVCAGGNPAPLTQGQGGSNGSGSTATCNVSSLTGGSHTIVATYTPTATGSNYSTAVSSATTPNLAVKQFQPAVSQVMSSLNPSVYTSTVTFTVTVAGVSGLASPTGTVTFTDSGTPITTCTNSAGTAATPNNPGSSVASCVVSTLTDGTHNIQGVFIPVNDANYEMSLPSSPATTQVIQDYAVSIMVGGQPATSSTLVPIAQQGSTAASDPFNGVSITVNSIPSNLFSDTVNFTCAVSGGSSNSMPPTCTLASQSLPGNGSAAIPLTLSAPPGTTVGTYTVTLTGMDANVPTLSARTSSFSVNVGAFSQTVSINSGVSATTQVLFPTLTGQTFTSFSCPTVYDVNANVTESSGKVSISCSSPSVPSSGGTVPIVISTDQPASSAALATGLNGKLAAAACLGLPTLILLGWRRKRGPKGIYDLLGVLILLIGIAQITGCGSGGFTTPTRPIISNATPAGSYQVNVIGTDANGNVLARAVVPLVVSQ